MLNADEVAEEIYQKLLTPKSSVDFSDPTMLIAQALTAYAEERVKEDRRIHNENTMDVVKDIKRIARAEALEEAKLKYVLQRAKDLTDGFDDGLEEAAKVALSCITERSDELDPLETLFANKIYLSFATKIRSLKTTMTESESGGKPMDSPGMDVWEKP